MGAPSWWLLFFAPRKTRSLAIVRSFHTGPEERSEKFKKYLLEDRKKTQMPVKRVKTSELLSPEPAPKPRQKKGETAIRRLVWEGKVPTDHYKNLNATAKQKYRSFNVQKKFTPSASVILLTDKKKQELPGRSIEMALRTRQKPNFAEDREADEKDDESFEKASDESKELVLSKEDDDLAKYKAYIFQQLRQIKKENEELKKRLSELIDNKNFQSTLQVQSDNLELERTKLKACWVIMSSTMEAFSNFCKRFTMKSDDQMLSEAKHLGEDDAEEEDDEEVEEPKGAKVSKYEDCYSKFLEKLMNGQLEGQRKRSQKL